MNQKILLLFLLLPLMGVFNAKILSAMTLKSNSFKDKTDIPTKHAYNYISGGKNISIHLNWSGASKQTKSYAILMWDKHKVAKEWVHWLVIDIPSNAFEIPENASQKSMPADSVELVNSFNEKGFGGPGPPKGTGRHEYVIEIYALNVENLNLSGKVNRVDFLKAIDGKVIEKTQLTGYFEQK